MYHVRKCVKGISQANKKCRKVAHATKITPNKRSNIAMFVQTHGKKYPSIKQ